MNRIIGQSLPDTIREIKRKQDEFSITPIGINGGWYDYAEPMQYVSATQLSVINTNVDLTTFWVQGDALRILQADSASYKYFFVYSVSANSIKITAGTDYTFTNTSFTIVSKGIAENPVGFPGQFKFSGALTGANTGVYSNPDSTNNELTFFSMVGREVTLKLSVTSGALTIADYIKLTPPVPMDTGYYRGLMMALNAAASWYESTQLLGAFYIYGNNTTPPYNFTSGGSNTNFAGTIIYNAST